MFSFPSTTQNGSHISFLPLVIHQSPRVYRSPPPYKLCITHLYAHPHKYTFTYTSTNNMYWPCTKYRFLERKPHDPFLPLDASYLLHIGYLPNIHESFAVLLPDIINITPDWHTDRKTYTQIDGQQRDIYHPFYISHLILQYLTGHITLNQTFITLSRKLFQLYHLIKKM